MSIRIPSRLPQAAGAVLLVLGLGAPAHASYTATIVGATLRVKGNAASDLLALRLQPGVPTSLEVDVGADGTADFTFDRSLFDHILVQAGGGDDTIRIDESGGVFTDTEITTLDGGSGDDTLLGGSGAETLVGGGGDDFADGNRGDDLVLLGAGSDRAAWDPGDGSDTIEGQGGRDVLEFHGANIGEHIDVSANGARVRFQRDIASITMDLAGVEEIDFDAFGGADVVAVHDLTGTDAEHVVVRLQGTPGGAGDGQPDAVVVDGTPGADTFEVAVADGATTVSGVGAATSVVGAEPGVDRFAIVGVGDDRVEANGTDGDDVIDIVPQGAEAALVLDAAAAPVDVSGALVLAVHGLGGDDTIVASNGLAAIVPLELYGGDGDDTLRGGDGADMIFGEGGDDDVAGGRGNDVLFLGSGDDVASWNPGDASDTIEGDAGTDALQFNLANIAEHVELSANGRRLRLSRDIASVTQDADGIEQVNLPALGGSDVITADDLAATSVRSVNVDLGAIAGDPDGAADTVIVNGTAGVDRVQIGTDAGGVFVKRKRNLVHVAHAEPALDALVVNGLAGADKIVAAPDVATQILLTINED